MDKKGASGPFHVTNGQAFHANGSCCSGSTFSSSSSSGPNSSSSPSSSSSSGSFEASMHHLHRGEDAECNGSPAKRCRLRKRTESVRRSRPRKCQTVWGHSTIIMFACSDICSGGGRKRWCVLFCCVYAATMDCVTLTSAGICTTMPFLQQESNNL